MGNILSSMPQNSQQSTRLHIIGQRPLQGEIRVSGAKNAATPILAATLLVRGTCVIGNVPRISDVQRMVDILRSLGATVDWTGDHEVTVDATNADVGELDAKAVKSMRSSILLMGPLLARFHQVTIPEPGGCNLGNRPIDDHLRVLTALGGTVRREAALVHMETTGLKGGNALAIFSVTATENAITAAVTADGVTIITLAATEPHVVDLCNFLVSAGARITGIGTHTLRIEGVRELHAATHTVIPDQIETATFAVLGALTKGELAIRGVDPSQLEIILHVLSRAGAGFELKGDTLVMRNIGPLTAFQAQTLPYPGFPTDAQALFGVLATQAVGTSLIHDPMYTGRFGYIAELQKMGANAVICDPHRVLITGPTPLTGTEIRSLDLRAGATLVVAGLMAQGETVIHSAEIIDRGYERLAERFSAIGAEIRTEIGQAA